MPFSQNLARSFKEAAILEHAPPQSGVYGLSNSAHWVYIGETDNIRATLLQHLRQFDTPVLKQQPTGFVFEVCDTATRAGRQDRLIVEYDPSCNRHSPMRHRREGSVARRNR